MKRAPRLTKKERKALKPRPAAAPGHAEHIHCVACGRHIDGSEFEASPATAVIVTCQHGSHFASCAAHEAETKKRVDEHDRTNQPVKFESAWH